MEDSKSFIFGFISLLSGTLGSIFSIFIPKNYVRMFKEKDWEHTKGEHEWSLSIPSKKHGMGSAPKAFCFQKNELGYVPVGVGVVISNKGDLEFGASDCIEGKLVIS